MEQKLKVELTNQQVEVIYRGLLELPTKFALPVIQYLEAEVKAQETKANTNEDKEITDK